jgi:hypothetical protein
MSPSDLASFFRLYNFFRGSGAKESEIESFITNINTGYITPGKAIELINQIYQISKSQALSEGARSVTIEQSQLRAFRSGFKLKFYSTFIIIIISK